MNYKEILEEWWNTEPFGYDNPDTYAGILKLLEMLEAEKNERIDILEAENARLKRLNRIRSVYER